MNVKLLIGIVLFVVGLVAAGFAIGGVAQPSAPEQASAAVQGTQAEPSEGAGYIALPLFSALSLAVGGLLIGISLGNWKNPRTNLKPGDDVVDPEGYHKMKHV